MLKIHGKDNMERSVHGCFQPKMPVAEFLREYSRCGGTHHLALTYETSLELIETFGQMMGWEIVVIG